MTNDGGLQIFAWTGGATTFGAPVLKVSTSIITLLVLTRKRDSGECGRARHDGVAVAAHHRFAFTAVEFVADLASTE